MDGLTGLEKVFQEEFSHAKAHQRRQAHVARNILAKVPKNLKQEVADDLRSTSCILPKKAAEFAVLFRDKWEKDLPSAVKSLSNFPESCLTFFSFPEEDMDIIENNECHRKTE